MFTTFSNFNNNITSFISDIPKSKRRGRQRLKTRSSRHTEQLSPVSDTSTDEIKYESSVHLKRQGSVTSTASSKESNEASQKVKDDPIGSDKTQDILNVLSESNSQDKLTPSLPPSRSASLNNSTGSTSKRKAVAIVRPQPQQLKHDPLENSQRISTEGSEADIQTKLENEILGSSLNEKLKAENKIGKEIKKSFSKSKIKSLSSKPELRSLPNEREARFSLYDFPSDSEPETDSSPVSLSSLPGIGHKVNNENSTALHTEDKDIISNLIAKSNDTSLDSLKHSDTGLKAAGNNNSRTDSIFPTQRRKSENPATSQSPPIGSFRSKSKSTGISDVSLESHTPKGISTFSSSHGCQNLSGLPITTIAKSFPTFDTKTTCSPASTGNNNKSLRPPDTDTQGRKHLSEKARLNLNDNNGPGQGDSLAGLPNKDAITRGKLHTSNTYPNKTQRSTIANSSSFPSSSSSPLLSHSDTHRMQSDTNTILVSSNYHPSQHSLTHPSHHTQGEPHNSSYSNLRDDRSDSGLSTLRSDGARSSGDERSGSRSSVVSDEILVRAAAAGGSGGPLQTAHTGRPKSVNAHDHARIPTYTPPNSLASLNPPFANTTSSSRFSSSAASYNKILSEHPPANINKASKLQGLPPMSSEARPPPPSAVSRGGTAGALGPAGQHHHHLLPSVSGSVVSTPPVSSSASSQQHAAVAAAMSAAQQQQQQWANVVAAHQYQAALQASQPPSQQAVAQQALLAQYQSLAAVASATGISPDVIKQYPHLASGLPHPLLQGRGSASAGSAAATAHHELLIAREREIAAERERTLR